VVDVVVEVVVVVDVVVVVVVVEEVVVLVDVVVEVVEVDEVVDAKLAVSVIGLFIVMLAGLAVPV
jgi:hypothetical protein